ncbi:MAG: flavodoxin reductase [Devosia sp.]|uniref:FAD-binding oxidoreductase n=1 Tax=Devosia sp. TaxID=1871048 RepID=UPI0024CBAD8A|nr:FAD-binding oxidoreductase [Devosia sp.]UYN98902.1 MAG: flavodoxin reductase [Devosia sp.]
MQTSVGIIDVERLTHNVRRYRLERPKGYRFAPGQATEVSLDRDGWQQAKRPFTFTCLPEDDALELTIKSYFDRGGVTNQLWSMGAGDRLILRDAWGTIQFKGPGTFIAGGAGVTPFIAILRDLNARGKIAGNRLIVSNQTEKDFILRDEFEAMDGLEVIWTVTGDPKSDLLQERIDADFIGRHVTDFGQSFYLCGPDSMVKGLRDLLQDAGADVGNVTWEK